MKVVLVTGGSKGIGLQAVRRFYALGFKVVTCSRNPAGWDDTVSCFPELVAVDYHCCDISDTQQVEALFKMIKRKYRTLHIAINSASPTLRSGGCFEENTNDDLFHTLTTDLWSHALCLKHELRLMREGASIVNVSSVNGFRPTPNAAMYSAAKHGLA